MISLTGKTAVVTGGGSGIGEGVAKALVNAGCTVAIAGRTEDKLKSVAENLGGAPRILYHTMDVAQRDSVNNYFDWAHAQLGHIDILVNSAGINIPNRSMKAMIPEDWDKVLTTNATGAYNCIHAVLPNMRERKDGLIISISSVAGRRAIAPLAGVAYCASKFAVSALATAIAEEERENGIRITSIFPGEVATAILDKRPIPPTPEKRAAMVQPEDIGAAVLLIASLPPRTNILEMIIKPTTQSFI